MRLIPGTPLPPPIPIFVKFTNDPDENRRRKTAHDTAWAEWTAQYGMPKVVPKKHSTPKFYLSMNDKAFYDFISYKRNVVVAGQRLKVSWVEQPDHIKDIHRRKFATNNEMLWLDIKRWWREWATHRTNQRYRRKYWPVGPTLKDFFKL